MIVLKNSYDLRAAILKNGYKFSDFARNLGISRSHLNKIFNRSTVSPEIAKKICEILNVDFDIFFYIKVSKKTRT